MTCGCPVSVTSAKLPYELLASVRHTPSTNARTQADDGPECPASRVPIDDSCTYTFIGIQVRQAGAVHLRRGQHGEHRRVCGRVGARNACFSNGEGEGCAADPAGRGPLPLPLPFFFVSVAFSVAVFFVTFAFTVAVDVEITVALPLSLIHI